jgi:hypothetical protein
VAAGAWFTLPRRKASRGRAWGPARERDGADSARRD